MAGMRESNKRSIGELTVDIDVSDALKGLKALKREANEAAKAIDEMLKKSEKQSKYKPGQRIKCFWAGRERTGVVVDGYVNYNNALQFTVERCEPACIIRFDSHEKMLDGSNFRAHEVVPHREIKAIIQ